MEVDSRDLYKASYDDPSLVSLRTIVLILNFEHPLSLGVGLSSTPTKVPVAMRLFSESFQSLSLPQ